MRRHLTPDDVRALAERANEIGVDSTWLASLLHSPELATLVHAGAGGIQTMQDTLGTALPREMTRVRDEVIPTYYELGNEGKVGLRFIRNHLDEAQRALAETDVVAMIRLYRVLKDIT